MNPITPVTELVGTALGWCLGPFFALTSALRRARTFHPSGTLLRGHAEPLASAGSLGKKLEGPVLVRFSAALWKGGFEHLDVLGCALRFTREPAPSTEPAAGDQDLLFATIRRPWTMPFSPLATDAHDYLGNLYFAVSVFDVEGLGRAYWRLRPERPTPSRGTRSGRLLRAVDKSEAALFLEVRRTWSLRWKPVARISLTAPAQLDQERMRFSPFRTGRGLVPRGLVHSLRHGVYALSQWVRPRKAKRPVQR